MAVDVTDDSDAVTLSGRWTVRGTGVSGMVPFSSGRIFGAYLGWLGPIPDAIGGGSAPLDVVLTAIDPTGNSWSVGTTVTLRNC